MVAETGEATRKLVKQLDSTTLLGRAIARRLRVVPLVLTVVGDEGEQKQRR